MPEPMKFCASMTKCSKAYTVGKPGRVKIAADRDPLDEGKLNKLLAFLADRLSEEDFAKLEDLIDDVVDDAEEANPSAQMAEDGYSKSTRRVIRRAHRNIALGLDNRPQSRSGTSPRVAHDAAGFAVRFPEAARIKTDLSWSGNSTPAARQPRIAMDADQTKSFNERFPSAARIRNAS
ncbi:MAG: hypothetical protein K2X54_17555 [Methylobacterium organophilum]|nr:hypothetical protein [Methylobacterium organophilum]